MHRFEALLNGAAGARRALFALCAVALAVAPALAATSKNPSSPSRQALEKAVADYVGLYTRETLDRWMTLFHPSLIVAYPTDEGEVRTRGLKVFFKAQKDYFGTGRKVSERLENVRIDEGRRIARVSADFVFVDEGQESRGKPASGRAVPHGRPASLNRPVQPEHLDEDVVAALMLRDNEGVGVIEPGDAFLAADDGEVLLHPVPLVVDRHDVVSDDVDLAPSHPDHGS